MKTITRTLICLSLLAALTSCSTKPQVDPVDAAPPATHANGDSDESSDSNADATNGKPKTPFHSTRMRLPDMEGLPSNQDLSPVNSTESGGAVIARPPTE